MEYPTDPKLLIPKAGPPRETITSGDFTSFSPTSATLLAPLPGGIAAVNSLPYADPSMEKVTYERLKNALETAKGFLNIEAVKLSEMSDPAIQLPLTTLRADVRRLKDEITVLERNPGIESTLTQSDLDGIEANLAYLQKKWRSSVNSLSGAVEGFASGQRASLSQLQDLLVKINVEINRLNASGTTDPTIQNRANTLKTIQVAVKGIVDKVNSNQLKEADITIMEDDYKTFLPLLSNPGSNLPDLLKNNNLSPTLASLFPAYQAGDISGAGMMQYMVDKYANTLFKGLSWDLRLNYASDRAKEMMDSKKQFAMAMAASSLNEQCSSTNASTGATGLTTSHTTSTAAPVTTSTPYRGEFASRTGDSMAGPTPIVEASPGGPGRLDWKQRSKEICEAIRKRGYEPGDFGCMKPDTSVGDDFSYRGYTKMVCSRLRTIYDISAPETCGCPPLTWEGWRM